METIGQRILAAVIGFQLQIPTDLAFQRHVQGREVPANWEAIGEMLLKEVVGIKYPSGRPGSVEILPGDDKP
jgi:hypothetical protein